MNEQEVIITIQKDGEIKIVNIENEPIIPKLEIENWNVENSKYSNACERTFCKDGICRNCQYKIYSKEVRAN